MFMEKLTLAIDPPAANADPYELSPFENLATTVPESIDEAMPMLAVADKMPAESVAELT